MVNESAFLRNGFEVLHGCADLEALSNLDAYVKESIAALSEELIGKSGSFIEISILNPDFQICAVNPDVQGFFDILGYDEPKLHSFYISAKPAGSDCLPWHHDLFYERETLKPSEMFALFYFQNTNAQNGCLRVIPGSHLWPNAIKDIVFRSPYIDDFALDIEIVVGDIFVGDRRLLHSTNPNTTDETRSCLTIAYAVDYANMSDELQIMVRGNKCLTGVELDKINQKVMALVPIGGN